MVSYSLVVGFEFFKQKKHENEGLGVTRVGLLDDVPHGYGMRFFLDKICFAYGFNDWCIFFVLFASCML